MKPKMKGRFFIVQLVFLISSVMYCIIQESILFAIVSIALAYAVYENLTLYIKSIVEDSLNSKESQ